MVVLPSESVYLATTGSLYVHAGPGGGVVAKREKLDRQQGSFRGRGRVLGREEGRVVQLG